MPVIDRIKISQEINFNGMPTWIGLEATLLPGEDEKDGLRQLQKAITDYQNIENQVYTQSKWGGKRGQPETSMLEDMANCTTEEEILSFRLTIKNPEQQELYDKILSELTNKK